LLSRVNINDPLQIKETIIEITARIIQKYATARVKLGRMISLTSLI